MIRNSWQPYESSYPKRARIKNQKGSREGRMTSCLANQSYQAQSVSKESSWRQQPTPRESGRQNCIECDFAGRICSHYKPVSWGGSPFVQRRFGESQKSPVLETPKSQISTGTDESNLELESLKESQKSLGRVDTTLTTTATQLPSIRSTSTDLRSQNSENAVISFKQIPRNPNQLSGLAPNCRLLLNYFAQKVTKAFSLHTAVQTRFCSTYIPMALQSSSGSNLMAAMLSLSAIHRKHAGVAQSEDLVAYLRYQSVKQLKLPVIGQSREADDIAMATTLMLCLSEIMSGGEKPNSWRLHLQGAAAIQRGMDKADRKIGNAEESPIRSFLRRWSVALEVLSLLCGEPMSASDVYFVMKVAKPDGGEHYIDEFHGFTTKLVPVFGEINLMSIELHSLQSMTDIPPSTCEPIATPAMRKRCFVLAKYIESMISEKDLPFHPVIQASITPSDRSSFTYLNEAYHHVALLQIYVRILNLPAYAPVVQLSVKRTIYCISHMNPSLEACPAVAILQPVFTAGCEACENGDRESVLEFLSTLERAYGMGNVCVAMAFLRELWVLRDERQERNERLRWDDFMREKGWELSLY